VIAPATEIRAAVVGIFQLWRGATAGFLNFDRTLAGFWRSYTACILGAPAHALLRLLGGDESAPVSSAHDAIIEAIAYMMTWVAFPLLMTQFAKRLGREDRFFDYMVPYNWAGMVQLFLFAIAAMVRFALPPFLGSVLMLVAIAAVIHLQWFIAREGLAISGRVAFLIVLADLSLSLLIGGIADYLRA
jgi:hypothetical protein